MKTILPLTLFAFFLTGCTTVLRVRYEPTAPARPLMAEKLPKIHLEIVPAEPSLLNDWSINRVRGPRFEPPLDEVLRDAVSKELGRLGLPLVSDRARADTLLKVELTQSEFNVASFQIPAGFLALSLTLRTPEGRLFWGETLKGNVRGTGMWVSDKIIQSLFCQSLAKALSQLGPSIESQNVIAQAFGERTAAGPRLASGPDVDEPPQAPSLRRGKAHAVVIGIRRYREALPEADFADKDAELVKRYLTQALGYPEANVALVTDDGATKSAFEKYFEGWLPNRVEKDAEVFVYFSGHGAPDPASGDAFLVPFDGDPTYLRNTGYPLKRLYAELAKLPARKVTVVMDSCFSGAGGRSVLAQGARPLVIALPVKDVPGRISVLAASAGDQVSHAYKEKGHGLFTYFLLKGLKEQSGRGDLDIKAAFDYAAPEVSSVARREYNADQVPQWFGER